jgi:hypothetical protein
LPAALLLGLGDVWLEVCPGRLPGRHDTRSGRLSDLIMQKKRWIIFINKIWILEKYLNLNQED